MKKSLTIQLDPLMYAKICMLAESNCISVASEIRMLLAQALNSEH